MIRNACDRIRSASSHLLTNLNTIGSVVLAYALANPGMFAELKALLPVPLQPFAPTLALGWFLLVQFAKARAVKPKVATTPSA